MQDGKRAGEPRAPSRCGAGARPGLRSAPHAPLAQHLSTWVLLSAGEAADGAPSPCPIGGTAAPETPDRAGSPTRSGQNRGVAADSTWDVPGAPCPPCPGPSTAQSRAAKEGARSAAGHPPHLTRPWGTPARRRAPYSPRCCRQQPAAQAKRPRPGRCPLRCTDPVPRRPHPSPGRAAKSPSEEHTASPAASCLGWLSPPLPWPPRPAPPPAGGSGTSSP